MIYDYYFTIVFITILIILLGFVAPVIGFIAGISWMSYGITRLAVQMAKNKNDI
jgi:prolipoprotein diacylglyceryltransferase